jgi:prepilin-type N-terminal cleavage/methylation domain-containing protein
MKRHGFTLIELLVVIAIIAILAAILFPVFAQAREKARQSSCISNAKQQALAIHMYAQDYDETLPILYYGEWGVKPQPVGHYPWLKVLMPYVKNKAVYTCPSLAGAHWDTLAGAYGKLPEQEFPSVIGYGMNQLLDKKPREHHRHRRDALLPTGRQAPQRQLGLVLFLRARSQVGGRRYEANMVGAAHGGAPQPGQQRLLRRRPRPLDAL